MICPDDALFLALFHEAEKAGQEAHFYQETCSIHRMKDKVYLVQFVLT
jgi:hypothetical protein